MNKSKCGTRVAITKPPARNEFRFRIAESMTPKTLQQAIQHFANFDNCREFMISIRWADGKVRCPYCGADKITYLENARLYRCYGKHPKQKFSLKVGTIFEDSPIPLEKWLPAVWLIVNAKNGISSYEIHRALGVTQKTAWFMLHRIRLAMQTKSFARQLGTNGKPVEVDETFIGGLARNMHKAERKRRISDPGSKDKTPILGMLERDGEVRAWVVPDVRKKTIQPEIKNQVGAGSAIYTDALLSYWGLNERYIHQTIDHVTKYVEGQVHTLIAS